MHELSKSATEKADTEMFTIKECAQQFEVISELIVRQLASRGKIISIRAGTVKKVSCL